MLATDTLQPVYYTKVLGGALTLTLPLPLPLTLTLTLTPNL